MSRRTLIILIAVAVLALAGVLFFVFRPKPASAPEAALGPSANVPSPPAGSLSRTGGSAPPATSGTETSPPAAPASPEVEVRQITMTFAERYGSFSSEGNFVNLTDLSPLMTERYRRATAQLIAGERAKPRSPEFRSTRTSVVAVAVTFAGATSATARVTTQRTDTRSGVAPRTYTQVLILDLLKTNEGWLVDRAVWEPTP